MHFSPLPIDNISFMDGCTAKSLIPDGTSPGPAVSPLGRPWGLGIGALMEERAIQSLVLVMAMVLSSAALRSFALVGKCNAVMLDEWWSKDPNSLFLAFSVMEVPCRLGNLSFEDEGAGGHSDSEKTLMRSSVLPVASVILPLGLSGMGESARQRMDEECALNRKVSE